MEAANETDMGEHFRRGRAALNHSLPVVKETLPSVEWISTRRLPGLWLDPRTSVSPITASFRAWTRTERNVSADYYRILTF